MRSHVMNSGHRVLGCAFHELAALDLDWRGCLPAVHPVTLLVITVVNVSYPLEPDPWLAADVRDGKLVYIGHPCAKDVAVFRRSLSETEASADSLEFRKTQPRPSLTRISLE